MGSFSATKVLFPTLILIMSLTFSCNKSNNEVIKKLSFPNGRYVWLYNFDTYTNCELLISQLEEIHINHLFISINSKAFMPNGSIKSEPYTNTFKRFLDMCKVRNISIHGLIIEQYEDTYRENHQDVLERLQYFIDFCVAYPEYKENPIYGIHLDLEPYALHEWKQTDDWNVRTKLMEQYLDLIEKIYNKIRKSEEENEESPWLRISSATAYFYDDLAEQEKLPLGNLKHQTKYLDANVPMAYLSAYDAGRLSLDQKIEEIIAKAENEVNFSPTVVGLNAYNFDSFENMKKVEAAIESYFKGNKNYLGVSFFEFDKVYGEYLDDL